MPCYDPRDDWSECEKREHQIKTDFEDKYVERSKYRVEFGRAKALSRILEQRNAMLCAVFKVLEKTGELQDVIENIDEKESGIFKEDLRQWWFDHKRRDEVRECLEKGSESTEKAVKEDSNE